MRLPLGFALMLSALLAVQAGPANAEALAHGIIEVAPSLTISHTSTSSPPNPVGIYSTSSTQVGLNTKVGYCLSRTFEVEGTVIINHTTENFPESPGLLASGSVNFTQAGLSGGVTYNFPTGGTTIPYTQAEVGFLSYSGDFASNTNVTAIVPSLSLGTRVMVGRTASVNFAINYEHETNVSGVQDLTQQQIAFVIGVSLFPNRR